MAKFSFTIQGSFETADTTQALLQLSHLAEISKININEVFKLDFTDIKVTRDVGSRINQGPNTFFAPEPDNWRTPHYLDDRPLGMMAGMVNDQSSKFNRVAINTAETSRPEDILDDLDRQEVGLPPQTQTKVQPQPWKDKLAGEGMPTD